MRAVVVVLLIAVLTISGCTSNASNGPRPSDAQAASSSPRPPTGGPSTQSSGRSNTWTLPVARRRYLAYVGPTDTLLTQLETQLHRTDLAALQRVCGHLWAGYGTLPRALQAGRWPAAVGPAVTKFGTAIEANRPGLLNCSTSETDPDAVRQARFASSGVVSAADAVRTALGLPITH